MAMVAMAIVYSGCVLFLKFFEQGKEMVACCGFCGWVALNVHVCKRVGKGGGRVGVHVCLHFLREAL